MNKKILLITTFFYPQNRIPVLRVGQWAKYWALMGYDVTVLTTKKYTSMGPFGLDVDLPKNVEIIEIDYIPNFLKKRLDRPLELSSNNKINSGKESRLKKFVRDQRKYIGSLLDIHDLWISKTTKKGLNLCESNDYELIVSSYSPPAVHVVASKLKAKYPNIKWIADFRDLWAYNHLQQAKSVLGVYEKYKEKKTIKNADILVTVSEPLSNDMKKYYPNKKIITIENGFDEDEFPNWKENVSKNKSLKDKLIITYAGTIYEGKRDPSPLFQACNELIEENIVKKENIIINFYGNNTKELTEIINKNNYNKNFIINLKGFVSREESLNAQKNSDLLLFLEWNDPSAIGVLTGKLFEYIVSGVPILAVGVDKNNSAGKLIEETRTGKTALSSDEIKDILKDILLNKIFKFYNPNIEVIEKYSRNKQVLRLIKIMEN